METTIKVTGETKQRINSLDITEKGKSYDMIINQLINYYKSSEIKSEKDRENWREAFKRSQKDWTRHQNELKDHHKRVDKWEYQNEKLTQLFNWAKSKGFKE